MIGNGGGGGRGGGGGGGVFSGADALKMRTHTGCDGIMVARGAEGNPFIFPEIKAALAGKNYTPPTDAERIDMAIRHLLRYAETKNGYIVGMRKTLAWYIKGLRNSAEVKRAAFSLTTLDELKNLLREYRHTLSLDKD